MLFVLFGVMVTSSFGIVNDLLASALPADAFAALDSALSQFSYMIPPTFAASVPAALGILLVFGVVQLPLNMIGRR